MVMITSWTLIIVLTFNSSITMEQISDIKDVAECQRLEKVIRDWRPVAYLSTKCVERIK
jgi:hypothetical protein